MDEISLDPYVQVRTMKSLEYEPNGKKISFISDITGLPQVWDYYRENRLLAQSSFTKEGITFIKYVTGTSDRIIGMDVSGNEREQLYLLKKNGELIALTNSPEHVHLYGGSSPDGKWIAWSSNRRNPAFFDIYIQNLETLEIRLVFAQNGMFTVVTWFPDGKSLLVRKTNSPLDHDLGVLSLLTGSMDWITEHSGEASFKNIHLNKRGDQIFLLSNKDHEFFALACIHLPTKQFNWLARGKWDFEGLAINNEKNKLAFTINEGGISKGILLNLDTCTLYTWETPMGVMTNLKFSPTNKKLLFILNGPAHPSDIWELDLESLNAKRLSYFSQIPILEGKLIEPSLIFYRSFDNLQIPAFYYKPKHAAEKMPVVIFIHGGPETQSRPVYNPLLQYFLNLGYAIITPNIRGSTGYGKTYTHLDDVRKRMDAVKDLISLVEWLKGDKDVDVEKIAVMGGSYGGFMVLSAISHYPNLWAAAVDIVGISSLRTFLKTTSPWRKEFREYEYGTIEKDGDFFDQIDPLNYADKISSPLMVIHGVNDPRVPIEESEQIVNKLKERNHPVTFIRFEEEGHSLVKQKSKKYAYSKIADFLEKYIGKNQFINVDE
ncbi:S9 family peptidase [Cytobacillus dafuensis]|uniref:S9 family peptidase n=1 Tax=Cytobacillus dafuensis TaxID=1742359 RepID=A0A5B8Z3X3_CYTDA|nr:S9 family peptidase [Cytobacillus dafuensis]QED47765.1 S9 family peptidase [Cytobacillus dafuensis]